MELMDTLDFLQTAPPPPPARPMAAARMKIGRTGAESEEQADDLYRQAQDLIDQGRYERAIAQLERLATMASSSRVDAALYWKAYSLAKLGQRDDALTTLVDMQKRFPESRWMRDAKALDVEIRQAAGQKMSPEAQNDEEIKLMILRNMMHSDPEQVVPAIEKVLSGNSSIKVKENALFVLSQSRSARAREIIAGVAKGNANPDLQLRAIRYLGAMGAEDNRHVLDDVYRTSTDPVVKRAILRSFMSANDRARLLSVAKSETSPELRGVAVQYLGGMRAGAELGELYQSEQNADVKKKILQGMFAGEQADKLIDLAKTEKDPELRRTIIRNLGSMRRTDVSAALTSIYASDTNADVRRTIINALFAQQNAKALIDLARAEKSPDLKKEIVSKLSVMKSKEATDYLLELLK
jgi:tetratricopeptide (TPR) repeat protein